MKPKLRKVNSGRTTVYKLIPQGTQELSCAECDRLVEQVSADCKRVICDRCVAKMADPPDSPKKPEEKRPRGWQFMNRYVSPSGKVYHKGSEVDESSSSHERGATRISRNAAAKTAKTKIHSKRITATNHTRSAS